MLTRLKVSGFKNLVDVEVHFGAFTCIAGENGVGKSNLFDAIRFLSALADKSLLEAAQSVREETDIRNLFHRSGDHYSQAMLFEADMIVPDRVTDDFGREVEIKRNFLRYNLTLTYRGDPQKPLEISHEALQYLSQEEAKKLGFVTADWSIIKRGGGDRKPPIETDGNIITQRGTGRPFNIERSRLERTVLSNANSIVTPTALAARREMQAWQLLQLEPSALRQSDYFYAPDQLGSHGEHLAATLSRLARQNANIYAQVANRLSELLDDVRDLRVDRDEIRQLLTVQVTGRDGTRYPARALSDGTLRFLALAVLSHDPQVRGVLCLEEPENGIHPSRITAIVDLLQSIAVDLETEVSEDNPLRQVIINTHSPLVVQAVPEESLLFAQLQEMQRDGQRFKGMTFSALKDTWRAQLTRRTITKGALVNYLGTLPQSSKGGGQSRTKRVADHEDVQQLRLFVELSDG
jgi:predicted ATPase